MAAPHSPLDIAPLDIVKARARIAALDRRAACDPALGARLAEHVLARTWDARVVAGFWPLPGEIDIRPLLDGFYARGVALVLPVTPPRGQPLAFRRWRPGDALLPGRFGTLVPTGEAAVPDLLLVPLLAFDRAGHRLGYGGGYYDRTLAGLPGAATLGCAFAAQMLDEVPTGPYDAVLDAVATEDGVIDCGRDA